MGNKPDWAEWVEKLPPTIQTEKPKTAKDRLFAALPSLNFVRVKYDMFIEPENDVGKETWQPLIVDLFKSLQVWPMLHEGFEAVKFDVPDFYDAEADGTPTLKSTFRLIAMAAWTLSVLTHETFAGHRPRVVTGFADDHFAKLGFGSDKITMRVAWTGQTPELVTLAEGVDTMLWMTILNFCKENPNRRDLLGKCQICLKLFEKTRKDRLYCSKACASKKRYKDWVMNEGLKRLALKRRQ